MSAPRQVLPGATYLVTRRCAQRQFLLRPSETTTGIFIFVLALAARLFGVHVHAFCVMSNHYHLVVTDPDARLPAFLQYLNAFVARATNASLERWETFWGPPTYSAVRLVAPADIVKATAYLLANPVKAGLVRSGRLWPGAWSDPDRFGGSLSVTRPRVFFAQDGTVPRDAVLELTIPPGFDSPADFRSQVAAALLACEREAQRTNGREFLGVARVLKQDPRGYPSSVAPRRNLSPRVAAGDAGQRIDALAQLVAFAREYRDAWARRRAGELDVVFPAGTYLLRVLHAAPCVGFG